MSTAAEVEARVKAVLDGFNAEKPDTYDYRITHYNAEAKRILDNTIALYATGVADKAAVQEAIRNFRDRSAVANLDGRIRVTEPDGPTHRRLCLLFGREPDERVWPVMTEDERRAYKAEKVRRAVELLMEDKQVITEKVKQQLHALAAATKDKSPALAATLLKYESYNAYQKRLAPAPAVQLNRDVLLEIPARTEEVEHLGPEYFDNSVFESRLGTRSTRKAPERRPMAPTTGNLAATAAIMQPAEPPAEHHAGFAAYCEELWQSLKAR